MQFAERLMLWTCMVCLCLLFLAENMRTDVNAHDKCSWYSNTFMSNVPARCLTYWENKNAK